MQGSHWQCTVLSCCVVAMTLQFSAKVMAQGAPRLAVLVSDTTGLSVDDLVQFQSGIEQICQDYGGFDVIPQSEVSGSLDRSERQTLANCGPDAGCAAALLYTLPINFALHCQIDPDPEGLRVTVSALNLADPRVETTQEGYMPGPSDTMYLLVPVYEALGVLSAVPVTTARSRDEEPPRTRVEEPPRITDDRPRSTEERDRRTTDETLKPPSSTNVLAMSLEISGAVVMAGGVLFWLLADDTQQEIQSQPHEQSELEDLQSKGDTYQLIGNIATATGAALMVTGLVFDLVGIGAPGSGSERQDEWSSVTIAPSPGGASLFLNLDF